MALNSTTTKSLSSSSSFPELELRSFNEYLRLIAGDNYVNQSKPPFVETPVKPKIKQYVQKISPIKAHRDQSEGSIKRSVIISLKALGSLKFVVGQSIHIGRKSSCEVSLTSDAKTSQKHALLQWRESKLIIKDLGSTNGTYLNGMLVNGAEIVRAGDTITVGDSQMRITFE